METLGAWVADPACAGNAMTLTVAGIIYTNEGNYVEALKACHTGLSLEMYVLFSRPTSPQACHHDPLLALSMYTPDKTAL